MRASEWSGDDVVGALLAAVEPDFAGEVVVLGSPPTSMHRTAIDRLATLPCVIVAAPGCGLDDPHVAALADLAVSDQGELALVTSNVERSPNAALALALLLRGAEERSAADGLQLESALFSALQAGPEHAAWRAATARSGRPRDDAPRVRVERRDDVLAIALTRTATRNALDVAMRDELLDALAIAEADTMLRVEWSGDGPTFCSGGDLDEFGTRPDPAAAHSIRLRRSIAAVLDRIAPRLTVRIHGACAGSGVELAAFADRVIAHPDASFVLPELSMGLIPGAGGTVSLPRRMGRHRTALLAFLGQPMDIPTAQLSGLVDEIELF